MRNHVQLRHGYVQQETNGSHFDVTASLTLFSFLCNTGCKTYLCNDDKAKIVQMLHDHKTTLEIVQFCTEVFIVQSRNLLQTWFYIVSDLTKGKCGHYFYTFFQQMENPAEKTVQMLHYHKEIRFFTDMFNVQSRNLL